MTEPRQAEGRGGAPVWRSSWAGLTLAASDSCTSSSTDSARQDRLSEEPRRRRPPHAVAIAARPSSPRSPEPRETSSRLGLRLGLLRQHFRLGLRVTGRAGSTAKCLRPGNGSRREGTEAARCQRRPGLRSDPCTERGLSGEVGAGAGVSAGPAELLRRYDILRGRRKSGVCGLRVHWEVLPPREPPGQPGLSAGNLQRHLRGRSRS